MQMSQAVDKILPKLLNLKLKMGSVSKSANNPFFKSKYADLNAHLELVEPLLNEEKLVLFQPSGSDERGDYVESIIMDTESGQYVSSKLHLVLVKEDMQNTGSAVTYARRYTLGSLLGMRAEDDDGEAAVGRSAKASPYTKKDVTPDDRPTKASSFRKTTTEPVKAVATEESDWQ